MAQIGNTTVLPSMTLGTPLPEASGGTGVSTFKTALNASGSAPVYACRAWVNFNAQGTVAIRASGNVSSITDNGVGDYTVNFTTAMEDANYGMASCGGDNGGGTWAYVSERIATARTVSLVRIFTGQNNVPLDIANNNIAVFR